MTFPKEFKQAISNLPDKEKDKLILRLLKKDLNLANRLLFELVSEDSVEERREEVAQQLIKKAQRSNETFYSLGYLNMDIRYMSGEITDHVRTTKDKFGEPYLNLIMLNEVLRVNKEHLAEMVKKKSAHNLYTAVIARAYKILILISKMHEDYHIEFEKEVKALGRLIGDSDALMRTAIYNGFDVNWLLRFEIPEDIIEHHKQIRSLGLLR